MTTNDIVIQKLTQILSYLRQGKRDKKAKKKEKAGKMKEEEKAKGADDNIYADAGDYVPGQKTSGKERSDRDRDRDRSDRDRDRSDRGRDRDRRDRDRDRDRRDRGRWDRDQREKEEERDRKKSYFEKPVDENEVDKVPTTAKEMVKTINDRFSSAKPSWANEDLGPDAGFREPKAKPKTKEDERMKKINTKMAVSSYAECYPGMMESADAIDDSDEEVDFTKMDQGNKKGPVGRWDFETQEEYSSYMSQKEALPKAAFQYGVKMADGRKTRRTGPKDEKKELDKEWQKIQNIIQKRKQPSNEEAPFSKAPKF